MAEDVGPEAVNQVIEKIVQKPFRRKLPGERRSITHKFSISGHEGYLTAGLYEDGQPGEIFVKMSKEGSTLSGIMDALALSMSMNLQYGVPVEVLVSKFCHTRFEPAGMTGNRDIPMVKSIMDYIGRWLALKFLPKETAKKYHNADLVDRAYEEGTNAMLLQVPVELAAEKDVVDAQMSITAEREHKSPKTMKKEEVKFEKVETKVAVSMTSMTEDELMKMQQNKALALNNESAPICSGCGMVMVQNGACYKCVACGATSGCS